MLHFPCLYFYQSLQKYQISVQVLLAVRTEIRRIIALVYLHLIRALGLLLRRFSVVVSQDLECLSEKIEVFARLLEIWILALAQSFELF